MKLVEDYKRLHEANAFSGMTVAKFGEPISKLIRLHGCHTVLDYGCAKGQGWDTELLKPIKPMVTLYDPGWPDLSTKPTGFYDAVLCIDVVEHIPEEDIEETLAEVFGYAIKIVIASFCPRGSKKKLSDGRDVHLVQMPRKYWEERFHLANQTRRMPIPWYLFCTP